MFTFLLALTFSFIYIGVQAYGSAGAINAIINSLFPIVSGGGIAKAQEQDETKIFETN